MCTTGQENKSRSRKSSPAPGGSGRAAEGSSDSTQPHIPHPALLLSCPANMAGHKKEPSAQIAFGANQCVNFSTEENNLKSKFKKKLNVTYDIQRGSHLFLPLSGPL